MSRYPGFIYGSNPSQSPLADCERTINFYPEQIGGADPHYRAALYPTPGCTPYVSTPSVGSRALFTMDGRTHAVMGGTVYEVFSPASATSRGSVAVDANMAQISYNGPTGNRLAIASGGNLCYINLTTNAMTTVSGVVATQLGMIDGYFVAFDTTTSRIRISPLNDSTGTWDPTQYAQRSIAPDPWKAMLVDGNRQIWLIGEQSGEVWYDSGAFPFPFAPIPGAVFRYGIIAPWSLASAGEQNFWLARNSSGAGIVVGNRGYLPQLVSTHAVESKIAEYARTSTIADAEAMVYQEQGHVFYCLTFPSANATWCYDLKTGLWHERSTDGGYWAPRTHTYALGQHLIGDRTTGTLSFLDLTVGTEADGAMITRTRIPPPIFCSSRLKRMQVSRFEVLLEPGLGTQNRQGADPQVMYQSSTDAKTWGQVRSASAGAVGVYDKRVVWNRCGSSLNLWVPRITMTDPIPWRILDADVEGNGFVVGQGGGSDQ